MKILRYGFSSLIPTLILGIALSACTKKQVVQENVLRYPIVADAKSIDPPYIGDLYSATVAGLVFEGLMEYHYLKRPHSLIPGIAESMPQVSKDELTFTFKLRKDAKYADSEVFPEG